MMRSSALAILVVVWVLIFLSTVCAQTTEISYQGQLKSATVLANDNFDFEFVLYDAASGGSQVGPTLGRSGIAVTNGIFSVTLDFGSNFPGAPRYIEIHVRQTSVGGAFTTLL